MLSLHQATALSAVGYISAVKLKCLVVLFSTSDIFEMSSFYKEISALLEAKIPSLEVKDQSEEDPTEDADVIKMAVRFDK